ncbi:hypothetical protein [Eisenibacter elegans]|jgi:hypothetical protein|uniref:hypothetical protein n=1 Tax=Eisenibacter elegans TaxID=997 RepID=UPI000403BEFB|nr:hypothetical protein [Eisenibacter elegans]
MKHHETEALIVQTPQDLACVQCSWMSKYVISVEYREALEHALQALTNSGSPTLLVDARNLGALSDETLKWTIEALLPRLKDAGCKQLYFVEPKDVFGRISLQEIVPHINPRVFKTRNFSSLEEAHEWIKKN